MLINSIENLYLTPTDLYRLGNATTAKLDNVRVPKDIPTIDRNGIAHVLPGNFGISLFTEAGIRRQYGDSWVWRIQKGTILPRELRLVRDHDEHYLLTPAFIMPLDEFRAALSRLAANAERVQKLSLANL